MASFGERLKHLRASKGISQNDLAKRFNLSQSTIAYYESDKKQPNQSTLQKMADYFDVTIDYLLGRADSPFEYTEQEVNFVNDLDLTDEELMEKYNFNVDGEKLTKEEIKEMLAYIRIKRHMVNENRPSKKNQ